MGRTWAAGRRHPVEVLAQEISDHDFGERKEQLSNEHGTSRTYCFSLISILALRMVSKWRSQRSLFPSCDTVPGCHGLPEKFYDFSGSVGFIAMAFVSLYAPYLCHRFWLGKNVAFPGLATHAPRQLLLIGALVPWAGRLSIFLDSKGIQGWEGRPFRHNQD